MCDYLRQQSRRSDRPQSGTLAKIDCERLAKNEKRPEIVILIKKLT